MSTRLARWWHVSGGLLVLLGIVSVTGIINFFVVNQRAFLNFYYLPVVVGAYLLGRWRGVWSALLSCAIVYVMAFMSSAKFGDGQAWMRWLDLITWGSFLVLTSYVVGSLYDLKEAQLRELQHAYRGVLEIMSKFIDSVDRYTENHSRRVADIAVVIARAMQLPAPEIENIRVGGLLHDIGKIDVSTDVLRKASGLTVDETEEMRGHVVKGEALVRSVGGILKHVLPMVAYHHERWDGTGYKGLIGENIPLGARIIAVADTYDAIITSRAYRPGRSHDEALAIIRSESGRQFDPRVVDVFLTAFAEPPAESREAA
ncbi:MAG: HD-GYP domain-containing protein [Candidatus Eisenbacteria bacterium]|nr:HD-GYP domain-containing protein [Candidatus Eisenbacteria bacterium]